MKSERIQVTFPPKENELFHRIRKSCPRVLSLAEHARNLLQVALDATAGRKK